MKNKNAGASTSKEESLDESRTTDEEESAVDDDEVDLNASVTDSDSAESSIGSNLEDTECATLNKSKTEIVKEQILQKYQERQGKQLYIRFPHRIPETQECLEEKIRELAPLVSKVHKPRQNYARFCLVDFVTKEDRDSTLNKLKKLIKKGELKKYVVNIPRTESLEFVKNLAERKVQSIENKKAKRRLKHISRKSLKENNFTSSIIVLNLPKTASTLEIRDLFTNVVDISLKPVKGKLNKETNIAAITFPTTMDARNAVKKKVSLGGNQLIVKFDNKSLKKKNPAKSKKNPAKSRKNPEIPNNDNQAHDKSSPIIKKKPKLE